MAYSKYSQPPFILEVVTPSATWERAMPCWQGPIYRSVVYNYILKPMFFLVVSSLFCMELMRATVRHSWQWCVIVDALWRMQFCCSCCSCPESKTRTYAATQFRMGWRTLVHFVILDFVRQILNKFLWFTYPCERSLITNFSARVGRPRVSNFYFVHGRMMYHAFVFRALRLSSVTWCSNILRRSFSR